MVDGPLGGDRGVGPDHGDEDLLKQAPNHRQRPTPSAQGEKRSLKTQERVGSSTEGRVVVKACPTSTLEVIEADFAFHLLIVTLDPPAEFRETDQGAQGRIGWEIG